MLLLAYFRLYKTSYYVEKEEKSKRSKEIQF